MKPEIEEFAEALVRQVRDRAIQSSDMNLRPNMTDPVASRWRDAGVVGADVVIPDVVDETIFSLLNAIDQELLPLAHIRDDGSVVPLSEAGLGELGGWYMGGGWRKRYSKERFVDDFESKRDEE